MQKLTPVNSSFRFDILSATISQIIWDVLCCFLQNCVNKLAPKQHQIQRAGYHNKTKQNTTKNHNKSKLYIELICGLCFFRNSQDNMTMRISFFYIIPQLPSQSEGGQVVQVAYLHNITLSVLMTSHPLGCHVVPIAVKDFFG